MRSSRTFRSSALLRLAAGSAVIGAALLVLWLTGALGGGSDTTVTTAGEVYELHPAETAIDTPNPRGLEVGLREGNLAPDFAFSSFDGEDLRLSDYRGQAVFLNFWATWCGPCRVELPDIQASLTKYGPDGVVVIGVNSGEQFDHASGFLRNLDIDLTAVAYDPKEAVGKRYGLLGLPTSFFIDREGVITRVVAGQVTPAIIETGVREALAGHTAAGR